VKSLSSAQRLEVRLMRVQVRAPKEDGEGLLLENVLQQGEVAQRIERDLAVGVVTLAPVLPEVMALLLRDESELKLACAARELAQVKSERQREAAAQRLVAVEVV
jgi:hypothetical protein